MKINELERLLDEYGDYIYGFCLKLARDKNLADELYQNTFLKVVEKIDVIDSGSARNYIIGIAIKLWNGKRRKEAIRNKIAFFISSDDKDYVEKSKDTYLVEEEYIKREEQSEVAKIIDGLNEKIRVVMLMFYNLEMSIEDIASSLKIPSGTVKSRLNKGRESVKKVMAREVGYAKR